MTPTNLKHWRLCNQRISSTTCAAPGAVVAWLGAMQAQDYPGARWSVGLRLPAGTNAGTDMAVEQALADGKIIRTWLMRGTLHFVAPADVHWMLALLTPRLIAASAGRHRQLGLDAATFARARQVLSAALRGGARLTRNAALAELERAGIATGRQRGYHLLWWLGQSGCICFGPPQGKQPTFVLLDEWVPRQRELARDAALAELARRYFMSHGPVTLQDFAWWSSLTAVDARSGLESVKADLVQETVHSKTYWMPGAVASPQQAKPTAYLLPGFDAYMLGYKDRSVILDPLHAPQIVPGNNGIFMPTIVLNGQVAGTWKRTFKKGAVVVTIAPFAPLSDAEQAAVAVAAQRYGEFLHLPATVS